MNLILFDADELKHPLPAEDRRTEHLLKVLKVKTGSVFDLGVVNGPRGKGTVLSLDGGAVSFSAVMEKEVPRLFPVILYLGAVRPPAARRILRDTATLGLGSIRVFASDRGEASYTRSRVWEPDSVRRLFTEGAEQGFTTRLPDLEVFGDLREALESLPPGASCAVLDNYEADGPLHEWIPGQPCVLAVGSERGWSDRERKILRTAGFTLVSAGPRVMRTETAVIAASALILSKLNFW